MFEKYLNYFDATDPDQLDQEDIRTYLDHCSRSGKSSSYLNQAVNAIKFYYEIVLEMPGTYYQIERPIKRERLPTVINKKEVLRHDRNKCIIELLYSSGLRRSELINLEFRDIDRQRMILTVKEGKGGKERYTILSETMLKDLEGLLPIIQT